MAFTVDSLKMMTTSRKKSELAAVPCECFLPIERWSRGTKTFDEPPETIYFEPRPTHSINGFLFPKRGRLIEWELDITTGGE